MSKTKIVAWLPPESASVKYWCDKPEGWDGMEAEDKFDYFGKHMEYAKKKRISKDEDPDWYDGLCCSGDDFEEERG